MKRNYTLDLLRIILCLFVIATHTYEYCGCEVNFINITLPVLFIAADGLFYILSGYFNLEKEYNSATEIKQYYKKKILYILIPFLAFVFVWTVWDYVHINEGFDFVEILGIYYDSIMNSSGKGHLWFMYPLFGMLLATPFLSRMLHNLDDRELKIFWRIVLGFNIVSYLLCENFGVYFRVNAWFMDGWLIYYIGGYYYRRIISKQSNLKWLIVGIICFTLTILGMRGLLPFYEEFVYATDLQPLFTLFCLSLLKLFDSLVKVNNEKVGKIILFLSGYTYFIYMYHMRGIEYIVRKCAIESHNFGNWMIVVFGTFAVSLLASIVTKLCLKPVQKLLDKVWKIKD